MTTPLLENIWADFVAHTDRFIRAKIADMAMADKIVQDVLVRLQRHLNQIKKPETLLNWFHLIARNAIRDHYRAAKTEIPDSLEVSEDEMDELEAVFRQIIHTLPRIYCTAILLTEFEGLTQKELAERLGISLSGAKSRVQRGRKKLKQVLLDCCQMELDWHRNSQPVGLESEQGGFQQYPTTLWHGPEDNYYREISGR